MLSRLNLSASTIFQTVASDHERVSTELLQSVPPPKIGQAQRVGFDVFWAVSALLHKWAEGSNLAEPA